jgi:hypothetical protein
MRWTWARDRTIRRSEVPVDNKPAPPAAHVSRQSYYLVANGALLMLAGLLCSLTVGVAPYPRLMLTAHIQFLVNGMMSVFAGLMLRKALAVAGIRAAPLTPPSAAP